jgi:hypothetical protein
MYHHLATMSVLVPLAFGMALTAGPTAGPARPAVLDVPVRRTAPSRRWARPPAPPSTAVIVPPRFPRRVASPRPERHAAALAARPAVAGCNAGAALDALRDPVFASLLRAAIPERGPPFHT